MFAFFIFVVLIGIASVIGYKIDSDRHSINLDDLRERSERKSATRSGSDWLI